MKTAEVTHLENEPAAKVDTSNFGRAVREAGVDGVVTKHDSGEKSDEDGGRGEGGSQGDHGWRERVWRARRRQGSVAVGGRDRRGGERVGLYSVQETELDN